MSRSWKKPTQETYCECMDEEEEAQIQENPSDNDDTLEDDSDMTIDSTNHWKEPEEEKSPTKEEIKELKEVKCMLTSIENAEGDFGTEILAVHPLNDIEQSQVDPKVRKVLEEFREIVASDESELGQVKGGVQHEIHLEVEEPIALSPIKIPLIYKD